MQEKGKVRRPSKGYWEIVDNNISGSTNHELDRLARRGLNLLDEVVRRAKSGEIPVYLTIKGGEFTVKLGKDIKKTTLE